MRSTIIEVQGHRGARGLAPENTLAGFEIALDVGVASIETDIHLTREGVPVLFHDAHLDGRLVCTLSLDEARAHRIAGPDCDAPVAERFAAARGFDARAIPTLADFFAFVAHYARAADKTPTQRERARRLIFDIELKRVPFEPTTIGDDFDGDKPALLEHAVVDAIRAAGVVERSRVRSFDHRAVLAVKTLEPALTTGVLIHHTLPIDIASLLVAARAEVYCPDFRFLDAGSVQQVIAAGKRVIPYTVNEPHDWQRLVEWGVHGICTDVPDQLLQWLAESTS